MGKISVKSHNFLQNVFAGHDVLKRSNGHSNQTGEAKLSFTNSPHLVDGRILENPWTYRRLQGLPFYQGL